MYQALYRQYRPRDFDSMMGQDHIMSTLKNQIMNNNVGHAYLFSGTRGTGKTSTAKIFSRAVSCLNPNEGNPCNECEICLGISDGSIMDVIEMDAASNRGVNDIRELRDKVVYPPSYAKYKVYIIDEVHMLTKEAFNALLKTLEEPPVHLIFILATTEPERIPQTILSRCQRFDFKRITSEDMMINMKDICDNLDVNVEEDALRVIANNADGAMRDALSLLDQCISFTSGDIKYEDAIDILGIVNTNIIFEIVDNIAAGDLDNILMRIDEAIQDGRSIKQLIKDIIQHFRDLMIIKTSNDPMTIMEIDQDILDEYEDQAEALELNYILRILAVLTDMDEKSRLSNNPRILLEMAMIRVVKEENISIEDRLTRIESGNIVVRKPQVKREVVESKAREKPNPVQEQEKERVETKQEEDKPVEEKKEAPVKDESLGEGITLDQVRSAWETIVEIIRQDKPNVSALLREGSLRDVGNNMIRVIYSEGYEFHKNAINNDTNKEYLEEIFSKYFGEDVLLNFMMENEVSIQLADKKKDDKDVIKEVIDLFGEDIVEIKD